MSKKVIAFLDTNIFLHYRPIDQIDWKQILSADGVTIIVPPVILRELNKVKDSGSGGRKQKRARKMLALLDKLFDSDSQAPLREGVDIYLENRDPNIDFAAHHLVREVNDDQLIASIQMYRDEHPDDAVFLVTADAGLILRGKAKGLGIQTVKLADEFRLKDEPDPKDTEIAELKQELGEYKNKLPALALKFRNRTKLLEINFEDPVYSRRGKTKPRSLAEIKQAYPHLSADAVKGPDSMLGSKLMLSASRERIEQYNKSLDLFYKSYENYLVALEKHADYYSRTFPMEIFLHNEGSAAANDIDVTLNFPQGLSISTYEGLVMRPVEPKPPKEPSLDDLINPLSDSFTSSFLELGGESSVDNIYEPPTNVSSTSISLLGNEGPRGSFHVNYLKHLKYEKSDTIYVTFESFSEARSFSVDYTVFCVEQSKPVDGKLHVKV